MKKTKKSDSAIRLSKETLMKLDDPMLAQAGGGGRSNGPCSQPLLTVCWTK